MGRLGGDEFLIVLCHAHSVEGNEVIQRIHDNLAARTITERGGHQGHNYGEGAVVIETAKNAPKPVTTVQQAAVIMPLPWWASSIQ